MIIWDKLLYLNKINIKVFFNISSAVITITPFCVRQLDICFQSANDFLISPRDGVGE